jgi:hypothetical protein
MNMDLVSSNDNTKSVTFIAAPVDSSKLAWTPPEYQADTISIADDGDMRKKKMAHPDPLLWSQNTQKETAKKNHPAKKKKIPTKKRMMKRV